MYSQETYTFKTRRKGEIFTYSLLLLSFISGILAANHQSCPDHCECYVDLQYEYNWHTAACDRLVLNRMFFPAIVHLKLNRGPYDDQCHLPNVTAKMFPNLQKLEMSNCSLTSIPSVGSNNFKHLNSLDVSYNLIRSVPSNALDSYQQMQRLNLANNPLNPHSPPAIASSSLYEISFDSCGIQDLPANTFKETPNLKFLTLSNNKISALHPHTFPEGLKTIDLSKNKISNVPTKEFLRLYNLAQINLSANPVNCTCELVEFQDSLSGKAVFFPDGIQCGHPRKYAGRNLTHIPENDLCDYGKFQDASSSRENCSPNQICNDGMLADEGYLNDQDKDENMIALKQDEVIPVDQQVIKEDQKELEQLDGSGDGEATDVPVEVAKPATEPSTSTSTTTPPSAETSPSPSSETTTSFSTAGVVKMENELNTTTENPTSVSSSADASPAVPETSSTPSSESPTVSSALPETSSSSTEKETMTTTTTSTTTATSESKTESATAAPDTNNAKTSTETESSTASESNTQLQERLQHDSSHKEMYGYLIPGLAVLLIGLVCLAVYCSQCASKVDTYKQADTNVEGAELQEVSLLPDSNHATIVKHSSKYPGEKENGQTERLMSDHERTNGGNSVVAEVNGNGSQHSDETIDCCKLANGQSAAANQNALGGNVECTVVRVTTLPDSVPKTAVIRDL